jgi:hypothetical protein
LKTVLIPGEGVDMTKEKDKKQTDRLVSPPKSNMSREDVRELKDFMGSVFDKQLQEQFSTFLEGTVKVRGKKTSDNEDEISSVSLRELTRHENPAITNVQVLYGIFNPDDITLDTYDLMKEDPTVSAGLAFIKLPIFALPWRIECDDERIRLFVENAMKRVWRKLVRSLLTAVEYGYSSHEKVFEMRNMKVESKTPNGSVKKHFDGRALIYKKFKSHYPDSIRVKIDKNDNFNGIVQLQTGGKEIPLKKFKCFFFTHEEEFGNVFGKSRLKPAYKYWYWKEILYNFMLMYYERRGSPPVIAHAPPGKGKDASGNRIDNLQTALDMGSSLLSSSVVALPYEQAKNGNDNQWGVDYLLDDKRGEMFIAAIEHLDSAILRALWIPERAILQGKTGSYSMASVHADLFLMAELGLVNDVEDAIDEQVIPLLVQANFKPEDRMPCYFRMDSMDWNRKIALKEIFLEMIRNVDNMVQAGHKPIKLPSLEQMAKILQIPVDDFEAEVEPDSLASKEDPNDKNKGEVIDIKTGQPLKRSTRTSFPGSREVDRKDLRPGGKRAEQMRAKLSETADMGVEEIFAPQPDEQGNVSPVEALRSTMIVHAQTPEGLHSIKKGLSRIKIWSGRELIQNFDLMGFWEIVRALNIMPDHYLEVLNEAMNRQLSEDEE